MHKEIKAATELARDFMGSADEFYESWWSGAKHQIDEPALENSFHPPIQAKFLYKSQQTYVHSNGIRSLQVEAGEFLLQDTKNSTIHMKATWSTDYWNWLQSSTPRSFPSNSTILRVYVPSSNLEKKVIAEIISAELGRLGIPGTLKYRRSMGTFKDAIVCWIDEADLSDFVCIFKDQIPRIEFSTKPPPLALEHGGLGFVEHPKDGSSVGQIFSYLIWTSMKSDSISLEKDFREKNLNIKSPWILNAHKTEADWEVVLK